jgi:hypothetical protein
MVGLTELESVTSCVSSRRSNQLSYKPLAKNPMAPKTSNRGALRVSLTGMNPRNYNKTVRAQWGWKIQV